MYILTVSYRCCQRRKTSHFTSSSPVLCRRPRFTPIAVRLLSVPNLSDPKPLRSETGGSSDRGATQKTVGLVRLSRRGCPGAVRRGLARCGAVWRSAASVAQSGRQTRRKQTRPIIIGGISGALTRHERLIRRGAARRRHRHRRRGEKEKGGDKIYQVSSGDVGYQLAWGVWGVTRSDVFENISERINIDNRGS